MGKQNHKRIPALKFILSHSSGQKRWFFLAVLLQFISVSANVLRPHIIRLALDYGIAGKELDVWDPIKPAMLRLLEPLEPIGKLAAFAVAAVVVSMLSSASTFCYRLSISWGTEQFARNLREKLFSHIQSLPFKWHSENQTGDIIQRCTSDMNVLRSFSANQMLDLTRTILMVATTLLSMLAMNIRLTLVTLFFLPIIGGYSAVFHKLIGNRFQSAEEAEGELTVVVQENLTAVRVVRAFGRERQELDKFDEKNNTYADLWLKLGSVFGVLWGLGDMVTALLVFFTVVAGSYLAAGGSLTLGEFMVFISYIHTLAWPVRAMGRTLTEVTKAGVASFRLNEILSHPPEDMREGMEKPGLDVDIRFEDVSFSYGEKEALSNLSFTIPKGKVFGILGPTGSGKSTITYLLNGLYDLEIGKGNIYFGDYEIRQISREHLRRNVGLVLQEPFLFSRSIKDNISIAKPGAQLDEIRDAAGIASIDGSINSFAKGYETLVGERGVTLSGGQKQRVAIARTILLGSPILVFDDSLSAVDLETDKKIRLAIAERAKGTTVILISHRINTLMGSDLVMTLENGKISDIGTHYELKEREGLYKRIYDLQADYSDQGGSQANE
ncbi:MAG: ABC transporter ATP-binding protein/permease [Eubacteriaceae bacterium]|nr:ABC transporter ATP-binding protein/permease [Eubacteriaceae bacterium]